MTWHTILVSRPVRRRQMQSWPESPRWSPPNAIKDMTMLFHRELRCTPRSMWSWDYDVEGLPGGPASIELGRFSDSGCITFGGAECKVRKQGLFSGCWRVENDGRILAEAEKTSPLTRSVELQIAGKLFTLKAQSAFTRSFDLLLDEQRIMEIQPAHAFTRRASIVCAAELPELTQLFAFWLVAMMWRRASRASAG